MNESEIVIIAGSREFAHVGAVAAYVAALPPDTTVMTGGARGVDSVAIRAARRATLNILTCYADWKKYGKAAGPIRNRAMAQMADRAVVFWDGMSRGSANMIEEMEKVGKPVEVIQAP